MEEKVISATARAEANLEFIRTMMDRSLMGVGLVSLAVPSGWGTLCLAVGFGGLNVVAGLLIARRHAR